MVAFAENKLSPAGTAFNGRHADFSRTPSGMQPLVDNHYQGMTLDAVTGLYYERHPATPMPLIVPSIPASL